MEKLNMPGSEIFQDLWDKWISRPVKAPKARTCFGHGGAWDSATITRYVSFSKFCYPWCLSIFIQKMDINILALMLEINE